MSDCCGCECGTESFEVSASPVSTDPREVVRGTTDGDFDSARPISCVIHTDWCCHRPTKAAVTVVAPDYTTCNGNVRVFVEGKRDFSQYVYAEAVVEANVAFPVLPLRTHFRDDSTHRFASYTPVFGTNTGDFVFVPRNVEDDDSYTVAAWPLNEYTSQAGGVGSFVPPWSPSGAATPYPELPFFIDNHFVGARLSVKCGYREDGRDTEIAAFMLPSSVDGYRVQYGSLFIPTFSKTFPSTTIAVGCHWEDIVDEQEDGDVRCGLQVIANSEFSLLTPIANIAGFGFFSFPFMVPRSLFVDENSSLDPKPADRYRYAGLYANADVVSNVPASFRPGLGLPAQWNVESVDSTFPTASGCSHFVTCAADYANVIVDTNESQDVATVPIVAQREGGGPVTDSAPYFVRRPDIIARVPNTVAAADSWHATHLVRRGSSLATRNAVHHLHLEFVQAEWPIEPYTKGIYANTPTEFPMYTQWGGQYDWRYPVIIFYNGQPNPRPTPNENGPQFFFGFQSDENLFGLLRDDSAFAPPPMWFWNAISGRHELTPFVGDRRLFPNSYHKHHTGGPLHTFSKSIATPASDDIERPFLFPTIQGGDRVGPYWDAMWAEHDAKACPVVKGDYRIAWSVDTYPQLWATTSYNESWAYNRPLDIPLQDSGMTTENYDAYARRNESENGGVVPWVSWDPGVGAVISVRARVGLKYTITKVQGFRRVREKSVPSGYFGGAWYYDSTGEVRVAGDHECNDVACTEVVSDFQIPLDGNDLEAISDGAEVAKQLYAGNVLVPGVDDAPPTIGDAVYRTVKVKVTKEE